MIKRRAELLTKALKRRILSTVPGGLDIEAHYELDFEGAPAFLVTVLVDSLHRMEAPTGSLPEDIREFVRTTLGEGGPSPVVNVRFVSELG